MVEKTTHETQNTAPQSKTSHGGEQPKPKVKTMGHEWDGIAELNNPLPRWWVVVFMVCIVWAVGYALLMPSVPGAKDFFGGLLGYSSRSDVRSDVVEAAKEQEQWLAPMQDVTTQQIIENPELRQFAMRGGEVIFKENCAACHMVGGAGAHGYPALVDDEWIWGGKLADIEQTIRHGIRWPDDDQSRSSEMPAFGRDEILDRSQIGQVADYVLSLSNPDVVASEEGKTLFAENCAVCHGASGEGMISVGAPSLNNGIWLYGGTRQDIMMQVMNPSHGQMPAWIGRLSDVDIKQVTVYVHSLGGGQ